MVFTRQYNDKFFEAISEGSLRSARAAIPFLLGLIQPKSVVDVGCGGGTWLAAFREHGVDTVLGLDGDYVDRTRLFIPSECFRAVDIAQPFCLAEHFDLAVSLEVAEHLAPRQAQGFIESLCLLAPVVLFSAAVPGQGGTHHVNEQWPEYWRQLFAHCGYRMFDPRFLIWYDTRIDFVYRQNLFFFVRDPCVDAYPALGQLPEVTDPYALMLVAPYIVGAHVGLKHTLKRFPALLGGAILRRFTKFGAR